MTHDIILHQISVSAMDNNVYLLDMGGEALLIDAADDAAAIKQLIADANTTVTHLLTTHQHWDHVRALEELLADTKATHIASAADAPALPAAVDNAITGDDTLTINGVTLNLFLLRGHTPAGVVVDATIDGTHHLFVGDSLFPGGVGKTDNKEKFHQLLDDCIAKVFDRYPDDTVIHPGHGKSTTVGAERGELDAWRAREW